MMAWDHGIQIGSIYGFGIRLATQSDALAAIAFAIGFCEGAWPDACVVYDGWKLYRKDPNDKRIEWKKFLWWKVPTYWERYIKFHEKYKGHWWSWLPGIGLHVRLVDPPYHKKPIGVSQEDWDTNRDGVRSWWSREWKRYLATAMLNPVGIVFTFF